MDSPKEKLRDSAMAENKKNILDCISLVGTSPCIFEGEKTYISTGAVNHDYIDLSLAEKVTYQNRPSRANLSVKNGDILFAKMCGTQKTVRIDKKNAEYLFSTGFYAVRAKETVITSPLLYYLLDSEQFLKQKDQNCSGATQKAITNEGLKKIKISLPPLEEQHKIAAVLDKVSDLIAKRRTQLNKLDELVKSRFIEMFGMPGTDAFGWGMDRLGNACYINPKKGQDTRLVKGLDVSFVPMPAVTEHGEIDASARKKYEEVKTGFTYFAEHDVLFAKITPCMENGKGAIARNLCNGIGFGSTEFHVLRPIQEKTNPHWIYTLTSFSQFREDAANNMTGSAGQRRVPVSFLENYLVSVPPLDLQNQFTTFVAQTDKSKLAVQKSLEKLEILKKALMQQYFG